MSDTYAADVVVIGGGLAGILSTLRLCRANVKVILIDNSLTAATELGGFAKFSGAKFSLPPAGMGLVPVVGSVGALSKIISEVVEELGLDSYYGTSYENESLIGEFELGHGAILRRYHSTILNPLEINTLIDGLSERLARKCHVVHASCDSILPCEGGWCLETTSRETGGQIYIRSATVFYAGGRLNSDLLLNAGVIPIVRKGLDIGVRIEATDLKAFTGLRALGPDAKIIWNDCRTFCLNSPGLIYRYPFRNFVIPGGIVADETERRANFGLLVRVPDKKDRLQQIMERINSLPTELIENGSTPISGASLGPLTKTLSQLFGTNVAQQLEEFADILGSLDLVDWSLPHKIHLPLLDWHWHTFAMPGSHKTNLDSIYVLGDSSGHARGLLQAAVSGWIAAEEYLSC